MDGPHGPRLEARTVMKKRHSFIRALLTGLVSLPAAAQGESPQIATVSLVKPSFCHERCRVSNDDFGGVNHLSSQFHMGGADQGVTVDDPGHHVTWVFFGDALAAGGSPWYGSHGANAQGYLDGESYGIPQGLRGSLKLITQPHYFNPPTDSRFSRPIS